MPAYFSLKEGDTPFELDDEMTGREFEKARARSLNITPGSGTGPRPSPLLSAREDVSPFSSSDFLTSGLGTTLSSVKGKVSGKSGGNFPEKQCRQPPNWDSLLFGCKDEDCDEILTYPEYDTYFVDCKLAEDVALNQLANYDLPVFNSLRNSNVNQLAQAVKKIGKLSPNSRTYLLVDVLMMDFLTCCCQEGNLVTLFEKCKDKNKRYYLNMIDMNLEAAVECLNTKIFSLDQLHSLERFVLASLERIPKSLNMAYFSVKSALKRKIMEFETEEKYRKGNSAYYFEDDIISSPPKKKLKNPLTATSKNWREQSIVPVKLPKSKPQPAPVPISGPESLCTPSKQSAKQSRQSTSTPILSKSSFFLDSLFSSDDEQTSSSLKSTKSKQVSRQILSPKKNVSLKTKTNHRDKNCNCVLCDPVSSDDLSEDENVTSGYRGISRNKGNGSSLTNPVTSPYKSKMTTWQSSKYVSPSKKQIKTLPMKIGNPNTTSSTKYSVTPNQVTAKCKLPVKVLDKVTYLPRNGPGRSPLKIREQDHQQVSGSYMGPKKYENVKKIQNGSSSKNKNCKCLKCQMERFLGRGPKTPCAF